MAGPALPPRSASRLRFRFRSRCVGGGGARSPSAAPAASRGLRRRNRKRSRRAPRRGRGGRGAPDYNSHGAPRRGGRGGAERAPPPGPAAPPCGGGSPGAGGSAGDGGRHRGEPGPAGGRAAAAALGPLAGGCGGRGGPGELREPPCPRHRPAVAPGPRRLGRAGGLAGPRAAAAAGGGPGRRAVARLLHHLGRPGRAQHHRGGHPERLRPGRGLAGARGGAGPRRGAAGAAVGAGGAGGGPAAAAAAGAAAGPAAAGAALAEALLLPGSLPPRGGRRGQQPHGAGGDAAGALGALPAAGGRRGKPPRPPGAAGSRRPQPGVEGGGAVPLAQVGGPPEPGGGVKRCHVCDPRCVRPPPCSPLPPPHVCPVTPWGRRRPGSPRPAAPPSWGAARRAPPSVPSPSPRCFVPRGARQQPPAPFALQRAEGAACPSIRLQRWLWGEKGTPKMGVAPPLMGRRPCPMLPARFSGCLLSGFAVRCQIKSFTVSWCCFCSPRGEGGAPRGARGARGAGASVPGGAQRTLGVVAGWEVLGQRVLVLSPSVC